MTGHVEGIVREQLPQSIGIVFGGGKGFVGNGTRIGSAAVGRHRFALGGFQAFHRGEAAALLNQSVQIGGTQSGQARITSSGGPHSLRELLHEFRRRLLEKEL